MSDKARVLRLSLPDVAATRRLGARIAQGWPRPLKGCIWLHGDLGAGKSELARAVLRGLGVQGAVRSPTYTLVEPYDTAAGPVLHLDCYRLGGAAELEMLGLDDSPPTQALWLVEWPERAAAALPPPDLEVWLRDAGAGRDAVLQAAGKHALGERMQQLLE